MPEAQKRRPVGLREVAEVAGVSRATASLVLRESPLVAADTRARVHAAMGRLGYIYNRSAANMRRGRTGTVGLLLADVGSPFYAELTAGLDAMLDREGLVSLFAHADESPERQRRQLRRLREYGADGVLLCPAIGMPASLLDELAQVGLPCVQTLRVLAPRASDSVTPDYALAMDQAVAHLLRLGWRRIAFIGAEPSHSAARDRLDGFRHALHRQGITDPVLELGPVTAAAGSVAIDRLLACSPDVDAVICYNDAVALGASARLQASGRAPGRDFAVIGADNLPLAASAWPALTTIDTRPALIGETAGRLLTRRLAEPRRAIENVLLPAPLVVRESCGAALRGG